MVQFGSSTPAAQELLTAVKANFDLLTLGTGITSVGTWSTYQFGAATTAEVDNLVANYGTSNTTGNDTTSINATDRTHFIHFQCGFSIDLFDIFAEVLDGSVGTKTGNDSGVNEWIIKNGGKACIDWLRVQHQDPAEHRPRDC